MFNIAIQKRKLTIKNKHFENLKYFIFSVFYTGLFQAQSKQIKLSDYLIGYLVIL